MHKKVVGLSPEFMYNYDATVVVGYSVLKVEKNSFYSKTALCYLLRRKFIQR
jgi:hypothetical protein